MARAIAAIEKKHPEGLSSKQIIETMDRLGQPLSEATLRKYVQLGLLPRSRRVGQKGKHRGSRGIYPVEVIRRVHEIRKAMDDGETLEDLAALQAVRARLSTAKRAIDDAFDAAEEDLSGRRLDKKQRAGSKSQLVKLRKQARALVRDLEKWSSDLQSAERSVKDESSKGSRRRGGV